MLSRREFWQMAIAASMACGSGVDLARAATNLKLRQEDLLSFDPVGNVTLLHVTDMHAQLVPVFFREPSINLGVGEAQGLPPHLTGKAFLDRFGIAAQTPSAYALTSEDFMAMARSYGRVGGLDRMATLIRAIRADRPTQTLFLDGGDTWQGSYTSLKTEGQDMVRAMNLLRPDAMTGHWEFTYGTERVQELVEELEFAFLAGNIRDTEWDEPAFDAISYFDRGGVKIAVIGQAFPYTPIANPRYKIPNWSFGIREEDVAENVAKARANGAGLVVLLSHNGFDVDRKLAARVDGIDVILTGHTHDALPVAVKQNKTLLIASGSHGKFLSRLDLDMQGGEIRDFRYKLIPVFSDIIEPDPEMGALIDDIRRPHAATLATELGQTDSLLYRRGNFNGSFDDLICRALMTERDAEIALSPGFRWGATLLPGQPITVEDVYNVTAITYPSAYRLNMTGAFLKEVLEDVADNLFNPDPYYQQGGDMVRVGGLGYTINPRKEIGSRITNMTLFKDGSMIDPAREYIVSGWASVNEATEGPAIYDVVSDYVKRVGNVSIERNDAIKVVGN